MIGSGSSVFPAVIVSVLSVSSVMMNKRGVFLKHRGHRGHREGLVQEALCFPLRLSLCSLCPL